MRVADQTVETVIYTFTVRVVGRFVICSIQCSFYSVMSSSRWWDYPIYAIKGAPGFSDRAIANNGLIVSASDSVRLECVSSQSEEGVITGRDGNTIIPLGETGVWRLTSPFAF